MRYAFDIRMTEADYADFNVFHLSRSPYGTKLRKSLRLLMFVIFAIAALVNFWTEGVNTVSVIYALLLFGMGILMLALYEKFSAFSTKHILRTMKKSGKMAFSPESRMEFDEEKILETTPEGRLEKSWEAMERLCILEGKVWYLYMNNTAAFILPVEQLRAQTDLAEFRRFLERKCPAVDVFEK